MRLAVFTSQFPSKVSTFFARDIRALIEAGIEVDVFAYYDLDPALWQYVPDILPESVLPRECVHHLTALQGARGALGAFGKALRILPSSAGVLGSALRYGAAPLAKTAYVIPKSLAWGRMYEGRFDAVMGYWGNYAATGAYLFNRSLSQPLPFALFLHAGTDLYRDRIFMRQKIRAAKLVATCSDFNRGFLQKTYPDLFPQLDEKLLVYHHGLDFNEFPFDTFHRLKERVIAVGNFKEEKGFDYLVRAMRVLKDWGVRAELQLVGDGPEKTALTNLADELGVDDRVIFSGWLPFADVRTAMQQATLLVHPSAGLGDGVPNVLKEATALGTPVIASNVSGLPEALNGGNHGLLVPPRDPVALADAIQRLLRDPALRRSFAHEARVYAEAKYDLWRNGRELAQRLMAMTVSS